MRIATARTRLPRLVIISCFSCQVARGNKENIYSSFLLIQTARCNVCKRNCAGHTIPLCTCLCCKVADWTFLIVFILTTKNNNCIGVHLCIAVRAYILRSHHAPALITRVACKSEQGSQIHSTNVLPLSYLNQRLTTIFVVLPHILQRRVLSFIMHLPYES